MFLIDSSSYTVRTLKQKGRGVFARRSIAAGTVIGDYTGAIVRPEDENEKRDGLYTMTGGKYFDILADPKKIGIHLLNHSCANNCTIYPYGGHTLFVALRRIFPGEEMTVGYMLGTADEKDIPCLLHACHCGTRICTGSMHDAEIKDAAWDRFEKRSKETWYKKLPGKYGTQFPPLAGYPKFINLATGAKYQFAAFGTEMKPSAVYRNAVLPPLLRLIPMIRDTGRRLAFPKLRLVVYGVKNNLIIAEPLRARD